MSTTSSSDSTKVSTVAGSVIAGSTISKKGTSIYDRNLNKTRLNETSMSGFAFLFSEMLQYAQKQVSGISDLERRLNDFGYRVGWRMHELIVWREKNPKREIRLLGVLYFVHTNVWKALFGKAADGLEKSTENEDEYMIYDNDPVVSRYISIPKDLSQLNCAAFVAGIVEAVLAGYLFPARVTAHSVPSETHPQRTVILVKFEPEVIKREGQLK